MRTRWLLLIGLSGLVVGHAGAEETIAVAPDTMAEATTVVATIDVQPFERTWYFRSETLVWRRRRVDDRGYVFRTADMERVLDTMQWSTPPKVGGRFTLGRQFSSRTAVEASGFFQTFFDDYTAITATPGTIFQPFFNHAAYGPLATIGSGSALVELAYQSRITSIELAVRHWFADDERSVRIGAIIGPRFFRLEEEFQDYDSKTAVRGVTPLDNVYRCFTDNQLYGGELGGMFEWSPTPSVRVVSQTVWAGFANVTNARNRFATIDGFEFFSANAPDRWFSGLIDLQLNARWEARAWLTFQVGYTAMYFWNMTSAPDVLSFNLLTQAKQNNELAFWVHGPTAGVELRW